MDRSIRFTLLFLGAILICSPAHAAGPTTTPTTARSNGVESAMLVDRWIAAAAKDPAEREAAEVVIARLPPEAFPMVEVALSRNDLKGEAKEWLQEVVARQKPYFEARTRLGKRWKANSEWDQKRALEQFDRIAPKDAKWHDLGRRALECHFAFQGIPEHNEAPAAFDAALRAGCDDPYVNYCHARLLQNQGTTSPDELDKIFHAAVDALDKSEYSAASKCYALMRYFHFKHALETDRARNEHRPYRPEDIQFFKALVEKADNKYWPETLKQEGTPPEFRLELAELIFDGFDHATPDRKEVFDELYPGLEKTCAGTAVPQTFKGYFYVKYAWDARGGGWANTVTDDGWRKMAERLTQARGALEEAWKLDPNSDAAATEMLTVELGQGNDRASMEKWFSRAMQANPDNYQACRSKMYYLEPKWHGSPEEMITFGRECLAARNWATNSPFLILDAHDTLATNYLKDKDTYFRQPEVWTDICAVYQPMLRAEPKTAWTRSRLAYYASLAGKWDEADRQFKLLGNRAVARQFGGEEAMQEFRRRAADEAANSGAR